jgi:drug/metabolite transporter (DMT)-like permease
MNRAQTILAAFLIFGVFAILAALFTFPIPEDNRDLLSYLISTVVGAGALTVINYAFGSSQGSADKAKTLDTIVSPPPPDEAPLPPPLR